MIKDATAIREGLLDWIQSRHNPSNNDDLSKALISDAVISDDGTTLTLLPNNIIYDTQVKLSVPINTNTTTDTSTTSSSHCEYTLGAIYLQIRNPKQSLIVYRNDCKKYGIIDPVKAIDKATIVNYFLPISFLGLDSTAATTESTTITDVVEPKTTTTTASTTTTAIKPESSSGADHRPSRSSHHDKSKSERSSSKHRDKDRRSSSSKSHHPRPPSSGGDRKRKETQQSVMESAAKKKKKPDLVTNEQLFEHLNVVVDKRSVASQNKKENEILATLITKALSAKGFEINNPKEQLLPFQERTSYILSNEIPVGNSSSILRANNPRKNLSRVLELYMETINPPKLNHGKDGKSSTTFSSKSPHKPGVSTGGNTTPWKSYLVGKKPIIVVPKGMTSPLTIINAHEFLCHGRFVSRVNMLQQLNSTTLAGGGGGTQKHPLTTFTRTVPAVDSSGTVGVSGGTGSSSGTGLLEYEIIDNPCKLGNNPKEWERIVAVIVLGQSWQFKDWMKSPIAYNLPASLFHNVFGYYIYLEGDQIPIDVQQWAVKKSQLNRDKRGLDSVTYASFWNELDEWMKVYKAELLPQSG